MPAAAALAYPMRRVVVQTARSWPSTDGDWTTQSDIACLGAEEGAAPKIGTARLVHEVGSVVPPGSTTPATWSPLGGYDDTIIGIDGQWVRLLLADGTGPISVSIDGVATSCTAFWWGVVKGRTYGPRPGGVGFVEEFECADLAYVLSQCQYRRGYELAGSSLADPGGMLHFNERPNGDKSASSYTVGGSSVHVHDRSANGQQKWTASEVVSLALAAVGDQYAGGPTWILSGLITALGYSETWDAGDNVFETITRILNPRRGLAFRIYADSAGNAYVRVYSELSEDVTAGGITIPQSDVEATPGIVGATDSIARGQFSISQDNGATYDEIGIEGDQPLYVLSLGYKNDGSGQLVKGWTAADETAWDSETDPEKKREGRLALVWRRFVISDSWNGGTYKTPGTAAMTFSRVTTGSDGFPDALYGAGGETGEFESSGQVIPRVSTLRFDHSLPLFEGYDWDTQDPTTADRTRPLTRPQVWYCSGGTSWGRFGLLLGADEIDVQPEENAAALVIGSVEQADAIKSRLLSYDLVVTVAVRHPQKLRTSWKRASSARPRGQSRSIFLPVPRVRRWYLAGDTVVRIDRTGTGYTRGTGAYIIDEKTRADQLLALATPWYSIQARRLAWQQVGTIDISDGTAPGALVRTAALPDGAGGTTIFIINNIITSRVWSFEEGSYGTSYTTERLPHDLSGQL